MPAITSFIMSGIISLISLILSAGIGAELAWLWPESWLVSWMTAFPVILFVLPLSRKIALFFVKDDET